MQTMQPTVADAEPGPASQFRTHGFAVLPGLLGTEELSALRQFYELAFQRFFAAREAGGGQGFASFGTTWIYQPETFVPELLHLPFVQRGLQLAEDLLGEGPIQQSLRIFHKPPFIGDVTPWHQDEAYQAPGQRHNSMNLWIPLEDVGVENGCLRYAPAPLRDEILLHEAELNPITRGLVIRARDPVPDLAAVDVPLLAGDAVAHHCRTLHSSRPNGSLKPRRALVMVCTAPPQTLACPPERPWLHDFGLAS